MKKRRTCVKTFMPCMAPLVEDGSKQQTVRRWPKRVQDIPRVKDLFSGREWTGKPYASKQRILREGIIKEVLRITIRPSHILLFKIIHRKAGGLRFQQAEMMADNTKQWLFAQKDGFKTLEDFHAWFLKKGALEFHGILIKWTPE
jgi:hypothetical protein